MPYNESLVIYTLNFAKNAINNNKAEILLYGKSRSKNKETLEELGITLLDALDEVKCLDSSNYHSGPTEDRDFPGTYLWIFKKIVINRLIYIKFKIKENGEDYKLKVISFHFDERVL